MSIDSFGTVVIRLVGGAADGQLFVVPKSDVPKFFGIGYPVHRYDPEPGNGDVRIYRYVRAN